MPQLKKLTALPGNILPKIEFHMKNTYSSYPVDQHLLSPSYLSMLVDQDGSILTSEPESDGSETTQTRPRKRQRLDHLSQEEKILRRKMKNRVAAQTARDRKKARMAELEEQVSELQTEKKVLLLTNIELRNQNAVLEKENAELKLRLGIQNADETLKEAKKEMDNVSDVESRVSDCTSLEYAEGTGHADSYSLDDAIRLLTDNSETDDLLDLLQQCSEDLMQCDLSSTLCQSGEIEKRISNPEVVGTSSKSLESHKELIHFDHIYYKQEETDVCPDISTALSLPESELSTKEVNLDSHQSQIVTEPECVVEIADSTDIPTIHITSESNSFNPVLHFESEVFPVNDFNNQLLYPTESNRCVSPTSSDAGYDSSFSASSPSDSAGTSWDETLTELFPSLV